MKTGLILVDIQNDYFPGGNMELVGMERAGGKAGSLLDFFRKRGWPTFHIQHLSIRPGATFFLPDTEGAQLHHCIEPAVGEPIIRKHFPNSFRDTSLASEIETMGLERVVICGAMSHMCIDASTRAAADLGLSCTVVHDACATKDLAFAGDLIAAKAVHGAFMAALDGAYANVTTAEDFISKFGSFVEGN